MEAGSHVADMSRHDRAIDISTSFHGDDEAMVILCGTFVNCLQMFAIAACL